jgi:pimeloyl-ACP methyl ester carboxylesterase
MTATDNANRPTAEVPQGAIVYRDLGDGDPIVFVHGLLVDGRLWSGVAERLADEFRCLVADWPMGSHRKAMRPDADLSPPGMAEIVVAFMDALGIERATVVGNDTGGAIAQIVTANHPDRVERLVLTNCDLLDRFPPFPFKLMPPIARLPGGMAMLAAPFRIGAIRRATYGALAKHPIPSELIDDWIAPSLADSAIQRDARKLTARAHKRHTLAAAEALRSFERPVRFAWAPEDRFFRIADAERLAAMVLDGRVERVVDAKTFVSLDQPQRVAELVAEFAGSRVPSTGVLPHEDRGRGR